MGNKNNTKFKGRMQKFNREGVHPYEYYLKTDGIKPNGIYYKRWISILNSLRDIASYYSDWDISKKIENLSESSKEMIRIEDIEEAKKLADETGFYSIVWNLEELEEKIGPKQTIQDQEMEI